MARTDIHRPSAPEFDPEAYECVGVFDLHTEEGDHKARMETVNRFLEAGYSFRGAPHGTSQCSHCGAHIRYAALMIHEATKTLLYVGEICLTGRFEALTQAQFRQLRETARLNRERRTRDERITAFVAEHPEAQRILDYTGDNTFVNDIAYKFRRYTEMSPRQLEAALKAIDRDAERAARTAEREAAAAKLVEQGVKAPTGKQTVEGVIVSVQEREGYMGGTTTWKMVVRTDEGWSVWSTVPAAIDVDWSKGETMEDLKGRRIRFNATLEPSDRDPLFAFAKRPTKAVAL